MITPASPNTPDLPVPVTKRANGRNLKDFGELLHAEKILLASCALGEVAWIGVDVPIDDSAPEKVIRASFLRFLLLGGDEQAPVHEKGVQLCGASIQEKLSIENCLVLHGMSLVKCKFDQPIITRDAHIAGLLNLSGSYLLQGLHADRLRCDSDFLLRDGFRTLAEVRLIGAKIGGSLSCRGGYFDHTEGRALSADGVVVNGGVFLNKPFKATGTVRLLGAQVGGDLECSGGQFEPIEGYALNADGVFVKGCVFLNKSFKATGTVRLVGAQIGGNLECSGGQLEPKEGDAFCADGAVVKGDVYMKEQFKANGTVRFVAAQIGGNLVCSDLQFSANIQDVLLLQTATIKNCLFLRALTAPARIDATSAQIGVLVDEPTTWAKGSILNGLVYRTLSGTAPTNAASRIAWLKQQSDKDLGEDDAKQGFRPQPWKQLQKVLREMGHEADAREVGIAFENQLRKADRIGQITNASKAKDIIPVARRQCLRGLHWLFGVLAGYGYRPMRLLMSLVMVWLFCALVYWWLALPPYNALGPTDPLVFQNPDYAACSTECKGNWMLCDKLPAEYTTFSPLAYSLDILLPLVDLGQEKTWGALVPTPKLNLFNELFALSPAHWVRLLNWFEILFGWVASLLFVAIVSGMSRRSEMDK
jgi:hypothetical protein